MSSVGSAAAELFIGPTLDAAEDPARQRGPTVRVISVQCVRDEVTADGRVDRVNVDIVDGHVVNAEYFRTSDSRALAASGSAVNALGSTANSPP
jgi:hypothetical protein